MHILITGAAGMIGRKLTERITKDGALNAKPVTKLTLLDIVAPQKPSGFAADVRLATADLAAHEAAADAIAARPETIFHLAGVVSAEAEIDPDNCYRPHLHGTP